MINEEQIEAHEAQFEREWAEGEAWRNDPNSGLRGADAEIALLKIILWTDYLRNEIEGNGQNWIGRTDKPAL